MKETNLTRYGTPIARILLSIIFVMAVFGKIMDPASSQSYMEAYGLPMVFILFILAVIVEIIGSLSVILGYKAKMGAWMLVVFLAITTLVFHTDLADTIQMQMFLKNLAIIGGLLLVAIYGAGPMSIDARKTKSVEQEQT